MPSLDTDNRFPDPDRAYRALIDAHRGLSDEESAALNTRLVLILANQIGDHEVLAEAIALARQSAPLKGGGEPRPTLRRETHSDTLRASPDQGQ